MASYGVVNLYLTFLEDLFKVYLVGIQVDNGSCPCFGLSR